MSPPLHYFNPYPWLAPVYDLCARALLLPFGGEQAFRDRVAQALELRPGMRVLELGCGTGSMTSLLLDRQTQVTAIDLSEPMLERARAKAPTATFKNKDILSIDEVGVYDRVLFSFVLHEMDGPTRKAAIAVARRAMKPTGRLAVVDFARSDNPVVRLSLAAYLRLSEPNAALELVSQGLEREIADSGLRVANVLALAMGAACVVVGETEAA